MEGNLFEKVTVELIRKGYRLKFPRALNIISGKKN